MSNSIVSGIHIYPIKSLGGISLDSCNAETEGFENDRRWMLVNKDGQFLTQRQNASLALFSCKLEENALSVSYKDNKISIPLQTSDIVKKVKVWSSKLKAQEVGSDISEWFSDHLGMEAYLVKMTDISSRYKRLFTAPYKTHVSFADGYPYLILSEGSMNELNNRMPKKLSIDRFRANIIVNSTEAHIEDSWKEINVGSTQLKIIKPCARCVVTTIDQQSGEKGKEPLKTLATYRLKRNKIYFGANTILLKPGKISVGDTIQF